MEKEVLHFGEGLVEVYVIDSLIHFKVFNLFNDEIAIEIIRYLETIFKEIPNDSIRIWDLSNLPSKSFKLTTKCVREISDWYNKMKVRKPGSRTYFIAPEPLIFGISRMYQIQASDDDMEMQVLNNIDELPKEIRNKITV